MNSAQICGLVIDACCVVIVLLSVIIGYRKGFASVIVRLVSFLVSVCVGLSVASFLAPIAYEQFVEKPVLAAIEESVGQNVDAAVADIPLGENLNNAIAKLPAFLRGGIETVTGDMNAKIESVAEHTKENLPQAICDQVIRPAAMFLIKLFVFLAVFLIIGFLLGRLAKKLEGRWKIPLVGKMNSFLGGVVGILRGAAFAFLFLAALWLILLLTGGVSLLNRDAAEASFFLRLLSEKFSAPLS